VFRQLALARIVEPTSKVDSLRVLEETGCGCGVVSDTEPPIAGIRQSCFPASAFEIVCRSCRARSGFLGAL
jgi:hypothetical protein